MTATTWELNLKGNAPTAAKRAAREVAALVKVLRDLKDVAPLASRALDGVAGPSTIRNLRTQVGLTRELGREMRKNNTESRRANRPAGGGAVNRGRTRVEGFTPGELARMETMNRRRRERDAAADVAGGRRASQRMQQSFRENDRLRRQSARNQSALDLGAGRAASRAMQRSFRENDQIRAGHQRAEARRARALAGPTGMGALLAGGGRGLGMVANGIAAIVSATLSAVMAVAGLAAGFGALAFMIGGALLRMISFREGTIMTLQTLMRVPGEANMSPAEARAARTTAARGEFRWASQVARETPLDTQQVVGLRRQAATSGYQGAEARQMTLSAADVGALRPDDPTASNRFLLQMGQLRNSAVARSADYRPAAQAAGVNETAAIRRAAIAAGVVQRGGETETAYQRRIQTAQGNGSITGRQMHDAILAEQRSQLGGEAGSFARSQSGSLAATLSNLGEGFQAFVTSIEDIENLPGILALKAMLREVADTLAGTTRNGKDLQAIFATIVNDSSMFVGTIFGEGGFDGALTSAMEAAKEIWPIVRAMASEFRGGFMEGFGPFIAEVRRAASAARGDGQSLIQFAREFGRSLGIIATFMLRLTMLVGQGWALLITDIGRLEDFGNAVNRFKSSMLGMLNPLTHLRTILEGLSTLPGFGGLRPSVDALRSVEAFFGIGQDMGRGVAAGFRAQQGQMQAEISSVMASLPATARTDMQIKSPSRVMAEIGEYMAEGVTVGLDSGAGGVRSAMSNVVAPPSLPGFGGGLGAMGGINVGGVTIMVNGAQDTAGVVDELRTKVEEIFVGLFERPALAGGA